MAVAAVGLLLGVPGVVDATQAGDEGLVLVGTFDPPLPPDATPITMNVRRIVAEPATRRLYVVDDAGWTRAYSLDTLSPLGEGADVFTTPGMSGVIVDSVTGGIIVASRSLPGPGLTAVAASPSGDITTLWSRDLTAELPGQVIAGVVRAPGTDVLWVVTEPFVSYTSANTPFGVTVAELNIGNPDAVVVNWTRPLPECSRTLRDAAGYDFSALGYVAGSNSLYLSCGNVSYGVVQLATPRGVARLQLADPPDDGRTTVPATGVRIFARDGTFDRTRTAFDPVSGRYLLDGAAGVHGRSVHVFDTTSDTYIGAVATGSTTGWTMGLDRVHGRMYFGGSTSGLTVSDIRATPVRQGRSFPEFVDAPGATPSTAPMQDITMAVDPVRSRLFLSYVQRTGFVVVEDRIPRYVEPPAVDFDAQTADVEEAPGQTEANYVASGQGYGMRLRQVGGYEAFESNALATIRLPVFPAGRGTREVRGAFLNHLGVSNSEAAASAIASDRDEAGTKADLARRPERPSQLPPDFKLPDEVGTDPFEPSSPWLAEDARCLDVNRQAASVDKEGASAACDLERRSAQAEATMLHGSTDVAGVGVASVVGTTDVGSRVGSSSRVTATARDIGLLGGRLRIREIVATAEALAHGRPGTARTSYTRVVHGVSLDGRELCDQRCDLRSLEATVNGALSGRLVIAFPEPERLATKGGYLGTVRRSLGQQLQEMQLNEQPPDRLEIPAFVATLIQDNLKPARTVFEAAAVHVDARYGITPLGQFDSHEDDFDPGTLADLAAGGLLGDAGGSPLFGLGSLGEEADHTVSPALY
ncbi:MAG: hypothetical protein M3394_07670, partial [Actinomycetota bacterium]|nr:hypothetical protein [Actinomycetota bacterium]